MKVVLLAGGYGTRISEESHLRPKPMIEIGGQPILWHIMKYYSSYGFNEFIICAGYKQHVIKEYFANYYLHRSDVTFDFTSENTMQVHNNAAEPWKVTIVDTEACKACGKCVAACPKHLISLVPYDAKYLVACSSKAKGPVTMKECSAGCIGCTLCQRNCPVGAAKVTDFLAKIDPETCKGCGICAEKCPKKVIVKH